MDVPVVVIKHSRKKTIGNGYETDRYIYDFHNLKINTSLEDKKDTFTFNVTNNRDFTSSGEQYTEAADFSLQDIITIYAYNSEEYTGTLTDHLVISGFIDDIEYITNESGAQFAIKGTNASDILMNAMVPATYAGNRSTTVAEMIVELIGRANNMITEENRKITASLAIVDANGNRTGGGYIWPTKSDGSSFPIKSYVKSYTNLYTHLKTLASTVYTADKRGSFVFYLDPFNELHFEPRAIVTSFTVSEYTTPSEQIKKTMTTDGMMNVVILNSGPDPYNNGILSIRYNPASIKKYGPKWKYITEDRIAGGVKGVEKEQGEPLNTPATILDTELPSAYDWTVAQSSKNGVYVSGVTTVSSNVAYKNYIRRIARDQGEERASEYTTVYGEKTDKIVWEPELGTTSYKVGDLINFTFNSVSFTKDLRVKEVQHSFENEWKTTVTLGEDVQDASLVT